MEKIDFFKGLNYDELATVSEDGVTSCKSSLQIIKESNQTAGIPERYANVRFHDYGNGLVRTSDVIDSYQGFCLDPLDQVFGISGPTGSGKTTLACCGIHERAVMGKPVGLFVSCRTLKPMIMTSRSFKATESEMDIYNKYINTPFLVIDELGKCTDEQLEWEFITTVFAGRYDNKLPTVFTTSFDYGQLRQFILNNGNKGEDIYDRLKSVISANTLVSNSFRGA